MKTRIIKTNPNNPKQDAIKQAVKVLKLGGLVILPTETVYGLAASYGNRKAREKLYDIKNRPGNKPFSVAIAKKDKLREFGINASLTAYKLIDKFWPGPLTLVLPFKNNERIGVRMPNSIVTLSTIDALGNPVLLPSANISGSKPPSNIEDALRDLDGGVDLAINTGPTKLACESTVAEVMDSEIKIIREGALKKEEIIKVASVKNILFVCTGNSCRSVMAEGLLAKALENRSDICVRSAGIFAPMGLGSSREVIEILQGQGIDVSGHLARRTTKNLLRKSDLILVMEKIHERRIIEIVPEVKNRVFLLKEFAKIDDTDLGIPDPIGRDKGFYLKVFYIIKESVDRIAKVL